MRLYAQSLLGISVGFGPVLGLCGGRKKKQDDIFIIGFDGSPDALKSIEEGRLDATLTQKPIDMGDKGIAAIQTLLDGGTVENRIFTPVEMIDSSNVEEFGANLNEQLAAES